MPDIDSFATKRGVARFSHDAVELDESVGQYLRALHRDYWQSDAWWRRAVFVGYLTGVLVGVGWVATALLGGRVWLPLGVAGAVGALWLVEYARGYRSRDRIPLDAIDSVSVTRGRRGLTRPRLVLTYRVAGTTRRRRVNLRSLYTEDGTRTLERATRAFAERGFEVE